MPRNRIAAEDRQRIIDAYANGQDYVETTRLLGIKRTTAWAIVRRNQLHGNAPRHRGGARNRKVDQQMIDNMVATVEQHSEYTLGQINTELRVALPNKPQITETTVARALKHQLIVLKKLETVQQDRNREDVLHARREYGEWLLNVVNGMNPRELILSMNLASIRGSAGLVVGRHVDSGPCALLADHEATTSR